MDDVMARLRAGRPRGSDAMWAADHIESLCAALDVWEAERKDAAARLEKAVGLLIWIAKGGDGATVDDLRYLAEMMVAEVTA